MTLMFRSITDESEVESLASLSVKQDSSSSWVTGLLEQIFAEVGDGSVDHACGPCAPSPAETKRRRNG